MIETGEKECTTCHETKPVQQFSSNKRSPDGRRSQCKSCVKQYYNNTYKAREIDNGAALKKVNSIYFSGLRGEL